MRGQRGRKSVKEKNKRRGGKPSGADAYRYLTGEAEVGGGAALLAGGGAHAAVGAAGRVLPFPPLGGGLSGGLSFGATSKEKQRQCQEHNAYRRRQGAGLWPCVCVADGVYMDFSIPVEYPFLLSVRVNVIMIWLPGELQKKTEYGGMYTSWLRLSATCAGATSTK